MSDANQVAARDTTFDNVIPERLWISTRTTEDRKYIRVIVEINGIEKEIDKIYVGNYDGIHSHSHQLTWILNAATDQLLKERDELKARVYARCVSCDFVLATDGTCVACERNKYKAAFEQSQLELEFVKQYLNPEDTSFRDMMDTFKDLPEDKKMKLINLAQSLANLACDQDKLLSEVNK